MFQALVVSNTKKEQKYIQNMLSECLFFSEAKHIFYALEAVSQEVFDVVIFTKDCHIHRMLEVIEYIRNIDLPSMMVVMCEREYEKDRFLLYKAGVHDCMPASIQKKEFCVRIQRLVERKFLEKRCIQTPHFKLFFTKGEIYFKNKMLQLRKREFDILSYLIIRRGKIVTREVLLEKFWSINNYPLEKTLTVHIARIRRKIRHKKRESFIRTVYGVGYVFIDE